MRADIHEKAKKLGVDIDEICNKALATAVGIDYDRQEKECIAARKPVIIAREAAAGTLPPEIPHSRPVPGPAAQIHPVINADDPAAITSVKRAKHLPTVQQAGAATVPAPLPVQERTVPVPADPPIKSTKPKTGKNTPKKKGTGTDLKKFIAESILREDAENASITKEALFLAFARWCRERRITQAPDRKALTVALKNQFALNEKIVDGEPSWVNVRLK